MLRRRPGLRAPGCRRSWKCLLASAAIASAVFAAAASTGAEPTALPEELPSPGGDWTRPRQPGPTYIAPAWHLDREQQLAFYSGMSFFRSPWVTAPASTTARDGLGPLFNSHSCEGCHRNGGRGRSLLDDPHSLATVVRVSVSTEEGVLEPHERYGHQLQTRATYYRMEEAPRYRRQEAVRHRRGEATLAMEEIRVEGPEARPDDPELRAPRLRIDPHHAEENPDDWLVSARVAPALLGLGLLEAIPERDLLELADPDDRNEDGVSGRPHWRGEGAARAVGRFGWKALHPTVAVQTGAAFRDDIGITNPEFPDSPCTHLQSDCRAAPDGAGDGGVEIPQLLFDYVVHFVAHMPPPRAGELTPAVRRGRDSFAAIGCATCHNPAFDTGHGRIWPYTDLLLHDMGEGLADHRPEGDANGREWRTAPLWGIGTARKVSGHTTLLHDGRARNVREAILWHDGEGAAARRAFQRMTPESQQNLLAFVNAL